MKPSNPIRLATLPAVAFLALTTLAPAARTEPNGSPAGEDAPGLAAPISVPAAAPTARVHLDRPGDGALWARGRRWKASFDESGATYYAGFGARQPRNLAHALSPDRVTVGGEPIAFERAAEPAVLGQRVEIDRGSFVEAYELSVDSIEQLFVFDTLPRAGDIVVEIPIASELDGSETADGLEFRNELGRVTYSRAVAIDARGRRAAAPTRLVDGAIRITVDADFVARAALPIVIDPVVSQFWLDSTTSDTFAPDMAWDPFHQVWLAVYSETFSATDTDIFARMLSATGSTLATGYVDFTASSWTRPRVANSGLSHQFLVVAERTSGTAKLVWGRMVAPNGTILTMDPQFDIGGPVPGDKRTPDVGGDPRAVSGTNFCVVFEHVLAGLDTEIAYRMVTSAGVPVGTEPAYLPDAAVESNSVPSISRSNGGTTWLVSWLRETSTFPVTDLIMAGRVNANGTVATAPFVVTSSFNAIFSAPNVSSPLASSERCAIAFASRLLFPLGSKPDVIVCALDAATVLQIVNLTTLENSGFQAQDQVEPAVDSDGQHFLVSYSEHNATFGHDECFVSDLYLAGNELGLAQSHVIVHPGLGLSQRVSQVAARPMLAGASHRYGVIYEVRQNDQDHDVSAVLFDGVIGGAATPFCFGDGTGVACPCGNNGSAGRGCGNSFQPAGALLASTGVVSTLQDTFRLNASGMPTPSGQVTFFQGTTAGTGAVFGDGVRCAVGTVIRLGSVTSSAGSASFGFGAGTPLVSVQGLIPASGGLRAYQVSYRNAAAFCTSATFNITNGVRALWAP